MSKRLILLLALVFVVGITFTAYAEVQNVKVSGDITVQAVSRNDLMLRGTNTAPKWDPATTTLFDDTYNEFERHITGMLSHVRVRVDADLTDNVSTTVRLINERAWGAETNTDTDIDLDLAFVSLKEFLYSPLTLVVGRQELMYGNGLIIGDPDTNGICAGHATAANVVTPATAVGTILPRSLDDLSLRKAFDAVKAILNYDPLIVDAVYAKVSEGGIGAKNDVDLYGVNANYALRKDTTVELYYWEKNRQKGVGAENTSVAVGSAPGVFTTEARNDVVRTAGARVQYTGIKNLSVGLESAFQSGSKATNSLLYPDDYINALTPATGTPAVVIGVGARRRRAYAIQMLSTYNLADLIKKYEPVMRLNYSLLSGDPYRSSNHIYRGWDPMFENQSGGTLFNKILGFSNAQLVNVGVSLKAIEDVKFALDYYFLRLMKAYKNRENMMPYGVHLTGVEGDPTYAMKENKKNAGNEIDANLTYDYTEDVQFGLSMGWFLPGSAFDGSNDKPANQVIGSMKVTF